MGPGVPEARRQCYNSPMNSDLSGTRTRTRAKMPFLGRTLCRGPTTMQILWGSRDRPTGSQEVRGQNYSVLEGKKQAYKVPANQGVGLQNPRRSKGRHIRSQTTKGQTTRSKRSRGRPTESQEVKRWAYRVLGGQGVGLQGPTRSGERPTGSQSSIPFEQNLQKKSIETDTLS